MTKGKNTKDKSIVLKLCIFLNIKSKKYKYFEANKLSKLKTKVNNFREKISLHFYFSIVINFVQHNIKNIQKKMSGYF